MSTKHTPGPWFLFRQGFSTIYVEARIGGGKLQEVCACGPTQNGIDEQEANAYLIAAAPELLKIAIAALALHPEWNEARAVIAKATGEQP